jgi:hypothetical protein
VILQREMANLIEYIDKRLHDKRWNNRLQKKWSIVIDLENSKDVVAAFSDNVFTNEVRTFFVPKFVASQTCECGAPATDRCHGVSRPTLALSALERVRQDNHVTMRDWIVQFFEEHKCSNFAFKCRACHKMETRSLL